MLRVINSTPKCARTSPKALLTVQAGLQANGTKALSGAVGMEEHVARYLQNVGAGTLYFAFGQPASPLAFNGILAGASATDSNGYGPGQQLDASNTPEDVWVYSPTGTTVCLTSIKMNDLVPGTGGIITANNNISQ